MKIKVDWWGAKFIPENKIEKWMLKKMKNKWKVVERYDHEFDDDELNNAWEYDKDGNLMLSR